MHINTHLSPWNAPNVLFACRERCHDNPFPGRMTINSTLRKLFNWERYAVMNTQWYEVGKGHKMVMVQDGNGFTVNVRVMILS